MRAHPPTTTGTGPAIDTFRLPSTFVADRAIATRTGTARGPAGDTVRVRRWAATAEDVADLARHLRRARERLLERPVDSIVEALDRAATLWLDHAHPPRARVAGAISRLTGFSPEMVDLSLDLELESSRAAHMRRALASELGDARVLDGFVPDRHLGGHRHAVGPDLVVGIASANIPGLPHLTVMRALLVKAAVAVRCSRGEPLFLPAWADTLAELDPAIGECVAAVDLDPGPGGPEDALLAAADHLVAYGGDAALDALARRVRPGLPASWHGHRIGFAVIGREALAAAPDAVDDLARRVAFDHVLFDREACLSPQTCFVEAGPEPTRSFAERVAAALARLTVDLPPRATTLEARTAFAAAADLAELREAAGEAVRVVRAPRGSGMLVTVERSGELLAPTPGARRVRLVPITSLDDVPALVAPAAGRLQGVAIEAPEARRRALARALTRLGASRITRPGLMGTPSMMWRHDGRMRIAELVRWVDEELDTPGGRP